MWIEATTMGHLVDRRAEASPDREALVFPDVRLTYAQLAEQTDAMARALLGLGVEAGDKVAILLANRLEYVLALFGAAKLGAIVVPVNARFKVQELSHVIAHSDARVLITAAAPDGTDYPALLDEVFEDLHRQDPRALALAGAPKLKQIVDLDGEKPGFLTRAAFEETTTDGDLDARKHQVRIRDVAMLMYTSGTSAKPKGCLLTHEALVRHGGNVARTRFHLTQEDSFWDPLPLFHIGGIVPMLGAFSVGAKFCHAGHFEPGVALRMLEAERATVIYPAFETIWLQVLDHPEFDKADLSAIRIIQSICVPERLMQLEARMPWAAQVSSYGATECSSNLTLSLPDDAYEARMNTLGRPLEGMQVKIADVETGERVPIDVVGELCFKGYALFEGYYKDPERTAEAFDDEGYFHSQDLAKLDADGRLIYTGRLKDMLKVGGENVSAIEVEGYLVGHPAVNIAQVVAAPDAKYGEVAAAFLQLKAGATLSEQEVVEFCRGQIASFKVPRHVRFVEEWPMSGTKIQKFVLRETIAAELS
jgi:fatty-acyl-CoA synthase